MLDMNSYSYAALWQRHRESEKQKHQLNLKSIPFATELIQPSFAQYSWHYP
jgi:hypothetical protein